MTNSSHPKFGAFSPEVKTPLQRLNWNVAVVKCKATKIAPKTKTRSSKPMKIIGAPGMRIAAFLADRLNANTGLFTWSRKWIAGHLDVSEYHVKLGLGQLQEAGFIESRPIAFNGKWERKLTFPKASIGSNSLPIDQDNTGADLAPYNDANSALLDGAELTTLTGKIQETVQGHGGPIGPSVSPISCKDSDYVAQLIEQSEFLSRHALEGAYPDDNDSVAYKEGAA